MPAALLNAVALLNNLNLELRLEPPEFESGEYARRSCPNYYYISHSLTSFAIS